jgi:hypothetical protein
MIAHRETSPKIGFADWRRSEFDLLLAGAEKDMPKSLISVAG